MTCVVQSRFASLKIVEDDFVAAKAKEAKKAEAAKKKLEENKKKNPKVKGNNGTNNKSQSGASTSGASTSGASTSGASTSGASTSGASTSGAGAGNAGGGAGAGSGGSAGPSASGPSHGRKKRRNSGNDGQWEEWIQKDTQMVEGHYQVELHQAILLSTLEFEAEKKSGKKEPEVVEAKGEEAKMNKKQKKNKTMSLGEFNEMHSENAQKDVEIEDKSPPCHKELRAEREFFESVDKDTKEQLLKEKKSTPNKHGTERAKQREPPSNEEIKGSQLRVVLEQRDAQVLDLQTEVEALRAELLKVKTRNKKLCNIIGQGEMKDKAQLLVEMERLREVNAELNAEVAGANATLQQERSRCVCASRQDKRVSFKVKKVSFDNKSAS